MSTMPPIGSPQPPPPPGPSDEELFQSRIRPWWGPVDVVLAVIWFMLAMIIAGIVTAAVATIGDSSLSEEPLYAIVFGLVAFQLLQAFFPWMISRWKGLGLEEDWRFVSALPVDIGWGLLLAICCFLSAQIMTVAAGMLVGLENTSDASNTAILSDNRSSPWIIGITFLVVVGAPLAEELLFRGLILRALQKSFGSIFAIVVSSVLFTLPHWQPDATWKETVVLLSALFAVGMTLAIGAVRLNRLGPTVIAHFLFNAIGTIMVFFAATG